MLYGWMDWIGLAGSQTICTARAPLSGANKMVFFSSELVPRETLLTKYIVPFQFKVSYLEKIILSWRLKGIDN